MDEKERERSVLERFLAADIVDGTVHRDVTYAKARYNTRR
jgi:hypothetical protein